jgi:cobalt/nickel transport system ATP-binding protein
MINKSEDKTLLKVTGLSFNYPDGTNVLKNISLNVYEGDRIGIVGPNGAGKTTFFMLICGVLKTSSGEILMNEKRIIPGKFHPEIGMVFQNPDDQLFCPSVMDDIAFGPRNLGLSNEEIDKRVYEVLEMLGIQDLANQAPHHLSGGQKRMAAIAGVLAMHPELVIYDEPTSNLDFRYRRRVLNALKNSPQKAMLIASHDLEFVLELCSRVVLLDEGRIIADGRPVEILGNKDLMEFHGLEKPHSLVPHPQPHDHI